jgi:hypothetical protein
MRRVSNAAPTLLQPRFKPAVGFAAHRQLCAAISVIEALPLID